MFNALPRVCTLLGLLLLAGGCAAETAESGETADEISDELQAGAFKVMTYNLRYQQAEDTGPRRWARRKDSVFARIRANDPDIFGVQEAKRPAGDIDYPAELAAGIKRIGDAYESYDPGGVSPKLLFWKRTRFELAEGVSAANNVDLPVGSESSCADPKGKKAAWLKLRDKRTGKTYFVVNTHLSPGNCAQTRLGAAIAIKQLVNARSGGLAVVIFGDMNADPQEKSGKGEETIHFLEKRGRDLTLANDYAGSTTNSKATFNSQWKLDVSDTRRIDYVFFSPELKELRTDIDRTANGDGISPSDHFPLIVTFLAK